MLSGGGYAIFCGLKNNYRYKDGLGVCDSSSFYMINSTSHIPLFSFHLTRPAGQSFSLLLQNEIKHKPENKQTTKLALKQTCQ